MASREPQRTGDSVMKKYLFSFCDQSYSAPSFPSRLWLAHPYSDFYNKGICSY